MIKFLPHVAASLMLLAISLATIGNAQANPLDDAKAKGLVGEQLDGYLGAVNDSAGVQALIDEINAKRKAKYAEIAAKRNVPIEAVAQITAKKFIERVPAGQYIKGGNGQWVKK